MKILEYLELLVYGFLTLFFIIYIGEYGISDLILKGSTKHELLFNVGVWFVLMSFCIDGFFAALKNLKKSEIEVKK